MYDWSIFLDQIVWLAEILRVRKFRVSAMMIFFIDDFDHQNVTLANRMNQSRHGGYLRNAPFSLPRPLGAESAQLLTTDYWLLTSDYWLLTTDYWLLTTDYWLLTADYWLLTTDYWLLTTTDYWLLTSRAAISAAFLQRSYCTGEKNKPVGWDFWTSCKQ